MLQSFAVPRRVAIVGAGTAGLAAALLLARDGHAVTLFERVPEPGPVGAGILLQPTGMAVLGHLGLLDGVLASGARIDRLWGTTPRGHTVLDLHYRFHAPDTHGLGLHRGVLFQTLWHALAGTAVTVRTGCGIAAWRETGGQVEVIGDDDRALGAFDLLIVANGTQSRLRERLNIASQCKPHPWGAIWAVVEDEATAAVTTLRQWFRGTRYMVGVLPTGQDRVGVGARRVTSLFWSMPVDRFDTVASGDLPRWKADVLSVAPGAGSVLEAIGGFEQLAFARYADVTMPHWHDGRVAVIGDAAHATSPQLGQGANLALVDAYVLAACMRAHAEPVAALAQYSALRRAHLRYYQQASRLLTPFFQAHGRMAGWLRDAGLGLACRLPLVRGHMADTLAGVRVGWLPGGGLKL
jgi:2-polyprenyl-6-methoxyphenol hydroxylase-like FAD-dependent oxidoreductase